MEWLKKSAKKINTCEQIDFYFDPPGKSFIYKDADGSRNADEWFRIRKSAKGNEIYYKYWHKDPKTGKSTYADEIETSIGSAEQLLKILKRLGFRQASNSIELKVFRKIVAKRRKNSIKVLFFCIIGL